MALIGRRIAGATALLSDPARETLARFVFVLPWAALALALLVFLAGVSLPEPLRYAPLVASALLFGMPHGAVDHLVPARVVGESPGARWFVAVGLLYAGLGLAYAAVWFLAPVVAVASFVLLTWFHWGQGELYPLLVLAGADHLDSRARRGLAVVVRGGLPMLVPLLAFPATYREVAAELVARFSDVGLDAVAWIFDPTTRAALGTGFALLAAVSLAWGALGSATSRRAWAVDAVETGLLWIYFLVVPPVFAVGLYFCLWHSVRHIARVVAVDDAAVSALRRRRLRPALARFAREAAPLTAVALALLGALYVVVPEPPATLAGFVALYLVLIAVLTLPHVVVVTWMDYHQAIWSPAG